MNRLLPLLLLMGPAFAPAASAQDGDQAAQLLRASQPGAASAAPESVPANGFQLSIRFVNTPGHPTNLIPSLGLPFSPGGLPNSAFERPITSENQTQLVVKAKAGTGSFFTQDIYLRNGDAVLQEGAQAPWGAAGELVGPLDEQVGIDNSGNLLITNGTSGQVSFTENDYVVILSPTGQTIVIAREGQPLLNANFPSLTAYSGAVWSGTMTSPILERTTRSISMATVCSTTTASSTPSATTTCSSSTMATSSSPPLCAMARVRLSTRASSASCRVWEQLSSATALASTRPTSPASTRRCWAACGRVL